MALLHDSSRLALLLHDMQRHRVLVVQHPRHRRARHKRHRIYGVGTLARLCLPMVLVMMLSGATQAQDATGFRALSEADATGFAVPGDMQLIQSHYLSPQELTYERYQQYFGAAQVSGAQITLYRDDSGTITTVPTAPTTTTSIKGMVRVPSVSFLIPFAFWLDATE